MCIKCDRPHVHHIVCVWCVRRFAIGYFAIWFVESAPIYLCTYIHHTFHRHWTSVDIYQASGWNTHGEMTSLKATNSIWTPLPYRILSVAVDVVSGLCALILYLSNTHISSGHQINLLAEYGYIVVIRSFIRFSMFCFIYFIDMVYCVDVNMCFCVCVCVRVSIFIAILTAWKMIYVPISLNYTQSYRSFIPIANILFA